MIKLFFKAIIIGVANIIPGVSGGTLAVILNVYDDIVTKIGNFLIVDFKTKIEYTKYLATIATGAAVGILLFANIIKFSITNYPKVTSGVFTALILPSIPFIVKGLDYKRKKNIVSFLLGITVMLIFIFLNIKFGKNSSTTITLIKLDMIDKVYMMKLFFSGMLAAGAMIIPGISGSLLLLMLGEYYNIVSFISDFAIIPLIFVGLGVGVGLVIFSKIIAYLLEKHREVTLFFITGIVIMSILQIWVNI